MRGVLIGKDKKANMWIAAEANSIEHAKELLDDLKALSHKYDITVNLSICPDYIADTTEMEG